MVRHVRAISSLLILFSTGLPPPFSPPFSNNRRSSPPLAAQQSLLEGTASLSGSSVEDSSRFAVFVSRVIQRRAPALLPNYGCQARRRGIWGAGWVFGEARMTDRRYRGPSSNHPPVSGFLFPSVSHYRSGLRRIDAGGTEE